MISEILKYISKLIPKSILRIARIILLNHKHFWPILFQSKIILPQEFDSVSSAILVFGHSNFLSAIGGTERIIVEQTELFASEEIQFVYVYPKGRNDSLTIFKPLKYGVILNGFELCEVKRSQIPFFFKTLQPKIKEIVFHHILFWPLNTIANSIKEFKKIDKTIIFYIHDFYFHCPKVNFFCQAGDKKCDSALGKSFIRKWRNSYGNILKAADNIFVPSDYMKLQLPSSLRERVIVKPPSDIVQNYQRKIRLAYLGAAATIKGYETWKKLANNALITRKYDLIHIGSEATEKNVPNFTYSFKNSKMWLASKLLTQLKIDQVLLWSQVPESYSFTYQEAINANKFVITSAKSGNIAYSISSNRTSGKVLQSDYDLVQFLIKQDTTNLIN